MSALVRFKDATIGYRRHPAVHHVTATIGAGSLTAIVGPNGAGKSTLLKSIVGLLKPMEGSVSIEGAAQRDVAYLPQQADVDRSFPIAVFDFVAMGLLRRRGLFGAFRRPDDEAVAGALAAVGLAGFEGRTLDTLSGGQVQRVLFARLALQDAQLVLLDEPFTAVDDRTTADLMNIVLGWHREGRTIVAVLHDFDLVRARFPETLLIARHLVASGRTADVMTTQNLRDARAMTEAWDELAPTCHVHEAA